jgi:hypothetical protein
MKKLTKILLGGAALCALSAVPVVAGNAPKFHFMALHAGRVVNKTKMHNRGVTHVTYTYGVSTYVPASDLHKRVTLVDTFYKWSTSPCTIMATNVRAPTKSQYAKIGMAIESYSFGCISGATQFFGNTYKLTNPDGKGQTDHFVASQIFKYTSGSTRYKATVNLDVSVAIGAE